MADDEELVTAERGRLEPSTLDVQRATDAIRALDDEWIPGDIVDLTPAMKWRPDLMKPGTALLHVHLAERLRTYVMQRLRATAEAGVEPHLALPIAALYQEDLLLQLCEIEARIHVLNDSGVPEEEDSLLGAIGGPRNKRPAIVVSPQARTELATTAWELTRKAGTTTQKGRRLEALLTFLLSQVPDFDVWERNLRTDTEELDIVVVQRSTTGRCWSTVGAPFILVECKNWAERVGQPQVSTLRVKMQGRRGNVRISLIIGASGFTGDALDQELRFASGDLTIAFIGPPELERWISADDGTLVLEEIISRAMLR